MGMSTDRNAYYLDRSDVDALAGPMGHERRETLEPWKPAGHSQLGRIVKSLAEAAGIADSDAIAPHMFRRWSLEAFIAQTGDLHSAAELAGHRDVNQTRRYAGRAKIARVRGGVAAIEAATAALSEQPGWAAKTRRDPSSGRTWVRTRDASSDGDDSPPGAAGGEVGA